MAGWRRIKRLAGLNENIADDPHTNAQIEALLREFDPDTQARILDALEAVKNAGPQGISVADWAARVRAIDPEGTYNVADVLRAAASKFPFIVRRVGDKRYGWVTSGGDQDDDVPPQVHDAVRRQVNLAYEGQLAMQRLGQFTEDQLARDMYTHTPGLSEEDANAYARHLIQQFSGLLRAVAPGVWQYVEQTPKTTADHMQHFRDLVTRAETEPRTIDPEPEQPETPSEPDVWRRRRRRRRPGRNV